MTSGSIGDPWGQYLRNQGVQAFSGQSTGTMMPSMSADASGRTPQFQSFPPGFSLPCSSRSAGFGCQMPQGYVANQPNQQMFSPCFNASSFASALGSAAGQSSPAVGVKSSAFDLLGHARPPMAACGGNLFNGPGQTTNPAQQNSVLTNAISQALSGEKKKREASSCCRAFKKGRNHVG